jgi:hypothetical protein
MARDGFRIFDSDTHVGPSGSQMSRYGNGSCAKVQAPVILMVTLGYAASASTFGNSAQSCAGGGGSNGCCKPRWSMTRRVFGLRAANCPASSSESLTFVQAYRLRHGTHRRSS